MSKVTYNGYRTGFPLVIPKVAEDGLPFQAWDGTTLGCVNSFTPLNKIPSKTSDDTGPNGMAVTVYGEESVFCVKLTKRQLAEYVWRAKKAHFSLVNQEDIPDQIINIAQPAAAGHWNGGADPPEWVEDPAVGGVTLLATDLLVDYWENQDRGGILLNRGSGLVSATEVDYVFDGTILALSAGYNISGEQTNDDDPRVPATCTFNLSIGWTDDLPTIEAGQTYNATFPNNDQYFNGIYCGNVIQVGEDEFWMAPFVKRILRSGPVLGYIFSAQFAGSEFRSGENIYSLQDGDYPATQLKDGSRVFNRTISNMKTGDAGTLVDEKIEIPFTLKLATGEISTTMFGWQAASLDADGDGDAASLISVTINPVFIPELRQEIIEWWSYDGEWNTETGALN